MNTKNTCSNIVFQTFVSYYLSLQRYKSCQWLSCSLVLVFPVSCLSLSHVKLYRQNSSRIKSNLTQTPVKMPKESIKTLLTEFMTMNTKGKIKYLSSQAQCYTICSYPYGFIVWTCAKLIFKYLLLKIF